MCLCVRKYVLDMHMYINGCRCLYVPISIPISISNIYISGHVDIYVFTWYTYTKTINPVWQWLCFCIAKPSSTWDVRTYDNLGAFGHSWGVFLNLLAASHTDSSTTGTTSLSAFLGCMKHGASYLKRRGTKFWDPRTIQSIHFQNVWNICFIPSTNHQIWRCK